MFIYLLLNSLFLFSCFIFNERNIVVYYIYSDQNIIII